MHDDVTTYCTPQKKEANWSWGSDQTFLGLEPEPGGYGHWVICMPCALTAKPAVKARVTLVRAFAWKGHSGSRSVLK